MKITILGAAGFIGTNLAIALAKNPDNKIMIVDKKKEYFASIEKLHFENVAIKESTLDENMAFDDILADQDVVYHLVSSNVPTTSNQHVTQDIQSNVVFSSTLFDACVRNAVKKVVFLSSGGTVYGKEVNCPLSEDTPANPISSYGLQKVMIEKLLYLYHHMYGLDYRIIRLANPYGPYQRPNGVLGAVTTFTYKALRGEEITVYGDGSVVRDFIYIDDAVRGIINVVEGDSKHHTYNIGCGYGTSIKQVIEIIEATLSCELNVQYKGGRAVDVPVNYLDIGRYERTFGNLNTISLREGILKTAEFLRKGYA